MDTPTQDDPAAEGLRTFAMAGALSALLIALTVLVTRASRPRPVAPSIATVAAPSGPVVRVTRVDGDIAVRVGEACELAIEPATHPQLNCRVLLHCGDRWLYGAGRTGYTNCVFEAGRAVTASDPSDTDGDPALDLDLRAGTIRVTASSHPLRAVSLEVEP